MSDETYLNEFELIFMGSSNSEGKYYFNDQDHPNVVAFTDAKANNNQITFDHDDKRMFFTPQRSDESRMDTHTVIPRDFGGYGSGGKGMTTTVNSYCLTHNRWENFAPKNVENIRDVVPRTLDVLPLTSMEQGMKDYEDSTRYNIPNSASDITPQEYEEARSNDVHPPTFDKATYKRVRNMGANHSDVINALQNNVPIEDYETALIVNPGSHAAALEDAIGYQDHYKDAIRNNRKIFAANQANLSADKMLSDGDHAEYVTRLFGHHYNTKEKPESQWLMHECTKLVPGLKNVMDSNVQSNRPVLSPKDYNQAVNTLVSNYNLKSFHINNIRDHIVNNRHMQAILNLGTSNHVAPEFKDNTYEAD